MKAAASIQQEVARRGKHISIVGIPKTIDNDINFIPHSFGFETAVDKAGRRHPLAPISRPPASSTASASSS